MHWHRQPFQPAIKQRSRKLTCQTPNAQKIKRFALQAGVISGLALLAACGGPPPQTVTTT
jgi:hypothetical protein